MAGVFEYKLDAQSSKADPVDLFDMLDQVLGAAPVTSINRDDGGSIFLVRSDALARFIKGSIYTCGRLPATVYAVSRTAQS
jgi:hypothetical protein